MLTQTEMFVVFVCTEIIRYRLRKSRTEVKKAKVNDYA